MSVISIKTSDFCYSNIKNYINLLHNSKILKKTRYTTLRKQILTLKQRYDDQNEPESIQHEIYQIILDSLNTESVEIVVATLDCLQKLLTNNFLNSIFQEQNSNKIIHVSELFSSIINTYKRDPLNCDLELGIIRVLISFTGLDRKYLGMNEIIVIISLFITMNSWSRSVSNKSAAKAALDTIIINTFQKLEKSFNPKLSTLEPIKQHRPRNSFASGSTEGCSEDPDVHSGEFIPSVESETTSRTDVIVTDNDFLQNQDESFKNILEEYNVDASDNNLIEAFLVYDTLCKSSLIKSNNQINHELPKIRCSLELLHLSLQHAKARFRSCECFNELNRKYLFVAITQDAVTKNQHVFKLCLNIFVLLLEKFRSSLKLQIHFFFEQVIFKILGSDCKSTPEQMMIVLKELKNICSNVKFLSVLFVNYDCDIESNNIFERLINNLCEITKDPSKVLTLTGNNSNTQIAQNSHKTIMASALQCIINILCLLKDKAEEVYFGSDDTSSRDESQKTIDKSTSLSIGQFKERKDLYEEGVRIFNHKPFDGLTFLIQNHFIDDDDKSIARFLHGEDRLDLVKIGVLLGENGEKWINVMHRYIEIFDVSNMEFLPALRLLLSNFRLPGEAQKIDRIMEKFASHYFESNKNNSVFKSADVAYLLAYSVIMLATDLHSPVVRKKINPSQYINMNKNADGSSNISDEYLLNIYDDILKNEIQLKSNPSGKSTHLDYHNDENLMKYMSKMIKMRSIFSENPQINPSFSQEKLLEDVESDDDITKSMFSAIWKHYLVCFGWIFNQGDKIEIILDCLTGVRYCVRIACLYDLKFIRDTYINSLLPFTIINKPSINVSELKIKNIAAIQTILCISREDGNFLSSSWSDILSTISVLETYQNIRASNHHVLQFNMNDVSQRFPSKHDFRNQALKIFDDISSQQLTVMCDQIFTNSVNFDADSVIHFVSYLCDASKNELLNSNTPKYFYLQKIVEVAYYNLNRTRIVWKNIWSILGPFLMWVASLENDIVSIFCVDSIRQLACKFLEKREYANFHFQSEFLEPFEQILIHNKFQNVKELGIRCVLHLIKQYGSNILSGWHIVFSILRHACEDPSKSLDPLAFECLCIIIDKYFNNITDWIDITLTCMKMFAFRNGSLDLNVRAIRLYGICFEKFSKFVPKDSQCSIEEDNDAKYIDIRWNHGWKKIITALITIIQYGSSTVRAESLLLLFNVLKFHSNHIISSIWKDIFHIIFCSFDVLDLSSQDFTKKDKLSWLTVTCTGIMTGAAELFICNFDKFTHDVIEAFFEHLKRCLQFCYDILITNTVYCFRRIIMLLHSHFDEKSWRCVIKLVEFISQFTTESLFFNLELDIMSSLNSEMPIYYKGILLCIKGDYLSDYSSYSMDFLRKTCPLLSVERENTISPDSIEIHRAMTLCRLDFEFFETIAILFGLNDFSTLPSESIDINPSAIFSMPNECLLDVFNILQQHHAKLSQFNSNKPYMNKLASYIENYSPALKQLWRGRVSPNMCIQETMNILCAVKFLEVYCKKSNFILDICSTLYVKNISVFIERYYQLHNECVDEFRCHHLIFHILTAINNLPTTFYLHVVKSAYKILCPLIKMNICDACRDLLEQVFKKVHVPLQTLALE